MYFGLCNALPFFQRIICQDFQEFLDKYKDGKEGRGSVAGGSAGLFRFFCDSILNKSCTIMKKIMEVG
jgi:hypothetical protein